MTHLHNYTYGDVPGLGECLCGAYRVWNRETQAYEEHELDGDDVETVSWSSSNPTGERGLDQ